MEAIYCPLCQEGKKTEFKNAWAERNYDGRIAIECPDCGRFNLKNANQIAKFASSPLSKEQLETLRGVIRMENKMKMPARLDFKMLK
ncbi:hypothetical protein QGN29_01995 [Temperatibacter marinus]|uniref:Uncharacterized protein n=1 Tax=Temperatibacter marinus TaxID=1456591 RepID=A0AA52ECX7_9PROT|nr:hypothetical protein [Temperatibacter marinus]WND03137.1 hypothetical protein QGN29_01995 [Temperatibacter marinus]